YYLEAFDCIETLPVADLCLKQSSRMRVSANHIGDGVGLDQQELGRVGSSYNVRIGLKEINVAVRRVRSAIAGIDIVKCVLAQDDVCPIEIKSIAHVRNVVEFDQVVVAVDRHAGTNVRSASDRTTIRKRVALN